MENIPSPASKQSTLSLIFGIMTSVLLCLGLVPIPFTGFICYPLCFLCGLLAFIFGITALNRIRRNQEAGSLMAWTGILTGGFVLICTLCILIALGGLLIFAPNLIHLPPNIQNFHV